MLFTALAASWALFHGLCAAEPLHLPFRRIGASPPTGKDFLAIVERNRARYSGTFHGDKARRASTELGIMNGADIYYYTTIGIGTPTQELNMLLDTSAGDVIVAGASCSSAAGCSTDITLYDSTKSSTASNTTTIIFEASTTIFEAGGNGNVSGFIFEDAISIGSSVVLHASFIYATQLIDILPSSSTISGILGLALASPYSVTTAPIWQSAILNGAPEFSFWLSRSNQSGVPGGAFTFGGTNASLYTGDIEYLNAQPATPTTLTSWCLNISEITVQGSPIIVTESTRPAVFEISSAYIAGPPADVAAIWSHIPGSSAINDSSGFYQYPCATSVNITVSFGGRTWPILAEDMNIGTVSTGSTLCRGAVYSLSVNGPGWIFGDTWMRNVYSVFRQTPLAMGFAQLSAPTGPAPSSTLLSTASSTSSSSSSTSPSPSSAGMIKSKSHAGAIAGGVVGALIVIGLLAGFYLMYRGRRRQQNIAQTKDPVVASRGDLEPFSFVIGDGERETSEIAAPSMCIIPERSLSTMKREQNAAIVHYGDTHFVPDSLVQTADGLQLTPGRESTYWPSSTQLSRGASPGLSPPSTPMENRSSLPPGARASNASSYGSSTEDPEIMQELRSLRAEVQRLQVVAERSEAPPSYGHNSG
ncbi:aspartic peptidase domain-containing protein [Mycena polygramma]|nr:aspartic peptidase domain-containing protein [Mycena polygramma]